MSKNNTFLTVAVALLIFVGGYVLGYLSADTADEVMEVASEQVSDNGTLSGAVVADDAAPAQATVVDNGDEVAFVIDVSQIPDSQRAFLRTMGIEGNEISVTNTMLACAEAEIGVERMGEIRYGATPSMSEGLKLAGCY